MMQIYKPFELVRSIFD